MKRRHTYLAPDKGNKYTAKLFDLIIKYYYSQHLEEIRGEYDNIYIHSFKISAGDGAELEYILEDDK